ncbi:hypothetical protein ACFLZP_01740 [Patescibacteria group bacterium]
MRQREYAPIPPGGSVSPEKRPPAAKPFDPIAEHTVLHRHLALSLSLSPDPQTRTARELFDDEIFMRLLAANQLAAETQISMLMMTPDDQLVANAAQFYTLAGTPLAKAQEEQRLIRHPYRTNLTTTSFIRDHALLANVNGEKSLVIPQTNPPHFKTLVSLYGRVARETGLDLYRAQTYFEGGNFRTGGQAVFTLSDSLRNIRSITSPDKSLATVEKILQRRVGKGGKELVVLDRNFQREKRQRVYHLDLLATIVTTPDGIEKVIVASLAEARKTLQAAFGENFLSVSADQWQEANQTDWEKGSKARMEKHLAAFLGQGSLNFKTTNAIKRTTARIYDLPAQAREIFRRSLSAYFEPDYDFIQPYIDNLIGALHQAGYSESQIVIVPGLFAKTPSPNSIMAQLQWNGGQPVSLPTSPAYSPACGFQYNHSPDHSYFLTGGGLRVLDQAAAEKIKDQTSLEVISLTHVLGLGTGQAGFDCIGLPIPA